MSHVAHAPEFYEPILHVVAELHQQGLPLREIAKELTARGIKTRHEFQRWYPTQVQRMLERIRRVEQQM